MVYRADSTIDDRVLRQIETSRGVGTWVEKKDLDEAVVRHLMRMATISGITGML